MKKNNTAEKSILEAEKLSQALKEGTENSLTNLLNEAINKIIKESDDEDENSFEEEDVDTEEAPKDETQDTCEGGECDCKDGECEEGTDEGDDDDEWSDMEQYKVGDNDYDFTGVDGDDILKVYNKLGDDDQIFVKKDEDGNYEVKDEETGAEYVIELPNADDEGDFEGSEDGDDDELNIEIEGDGEGDEGGYEEAPEFDNGADEDGEGETEYEFDNGDDEEEDDEDMLNEENLGYTDNYQKDVMPGLNMKEPADSKTTYSMDGGAPEGNSRPFSGYENKKSNLFTQKVNEDEEGDGEMQECSICEEDMPNIDANASTQSMPTSTPTMEEGAMTVSSQSVAKTTHTPTSEPRAEHKREVAKLVHNKGAYVSEAYVKGIVSKAKEIQEENKKYAKALESIKESVSKAALLNVSLSQIVKLLSENTTSASEKKSIIDRFSTVKTISESKNLYNTIKTELNEGAKSSVVLERQMSVDGSKVLNETTMYQRNSNPALNLMDRLENLYKN